MSDIPGTNLDLQNATDEELRAHIKALMQRATKSRNDRREIVGDGYLYYEYPHSTKFKFESHGIHVENSEIGDDVADFHFLPRGVMNSNEINRSEHFRFKSQSIISFIKGAEALIKFIRENPETRLGALNSFYGETNEEMARFLKRRIGIDYTEIQGQVGDYRVAFFLEDLIQGIKKFRAEHPKIAAIIDQTTEEE